MNVNKPRNRRATMIDVAQRAGVSYQTVSRVLNNHPNVAAETRDRVLAIIQELKYRPSQAARSLAAKRSHALAVITNSMHHYGPTQMVANIDRYARDADYDLMVVHVDPFSGASMAAAVDRILRWSVAGVLLIAPVENVHYTQLVGELAEMPMIQFDNAPGAAAPAVIVDQGAGSRLITQYVLDAGHRLIGEISGPLDWFGAAARHRGLHETLDAHGVSAAASRQGDWSAESGFAAASAILNETPVTALIAANDQMALGAMGAARARGLRVPDDVSVVGFDDIPEAGYFYPALTTIRQDFAELARMGLEYLVELIDDPASARGQQRIAPRLIVRGSVSPVQRAHT